MADSSVSWVLVPFTRARLFCYLTSWHAATTMSPSSHTPPRFLCHVVYVSVWRKEVEVTNTDDPSERALVGFCNSDSQSRPPLRDRSVRLKCSTHKATLHHPDPHEQEIIFSTDTVHAFLLVTKKGQRLLNNGERPRGPALVQGNPVNGSAVLCGKN